MWRGVQLKEKVVAFFTRLLRQVGFRQYGVNLLWLFAEKFLRMAVGFSVGTYVARQLGTTEFGVLSYSLSYCAIWGVMCGLGLEPVVVRELVLRPAARDRILGSAWLLKFAAWLPAFLIVGILMAVSKQDWETKSLILLLMGGYCSQTLLVLDSYFQAKVESRYVAIAQMTALLAMSAVRLLLAWNNCPVICFAAAEVGNMVLTQAGYCFFYYRRVRQWSWSCRWGEMGYLLRQTWPLWVAATAGISAMRIDQVMLKNMLGDSEVGCYMAAVRLVEIFYFVGIALSGTLFPPILQAKRDSIDGYQRRLKGFFSLLFYLNLGLVLGMACLGHLAIGLYGAAYAASYPIFMIYIWRILFCAMGVGGSNYYLSENLQHYSMWFSLVVMGLNVLFNYILIGRFGVLGAAATAVLTNLIAVYLLPLSSRTTRRLAVLQLAALDPRWLWRWRTQR
ncbi:flippase [Victivallis sp. Marseille-Q1083]|uniref:flippase n=1 Tax=Victivallis sp. Marseille-Q1083 TaxID=2717288 RepID=UPI001589A9C6|nr:flippase [Victivallis sp. Marseille-Q1083]